MIAGALVGAAAGAGALAYAARGRSATFFGPSVYRGDPHRKALALTFDDGPSPSTPALLRVLEEYGLPATFFVCGVHVRRLPEVARELASRGHELGNHSDTHARFWLRSQRFIAGELERAQAAIGEATGKRPVLLRAPYGVRWFGLAQAQRRLGLLGVMWTVLGRDYSLDGARVAARITHGASNGGIICLHDGRELEPNPDISSTVEGVRRAVPQLLEQGYQFHTVSDLICPTT